MNIICSSCRKSIPTTDKIGRAETCPHCTADLHVCKQCLFYDALSYNECRESQAERVLDKAKANFCDYFSVNKNPRQQESRADEAKRKLEDLFKK